MRIADAMTDTGIGLSSQVILDDRDLSTTCPACSDHQTLAEAVREDEGPTDAIYRCRGCQATLAAIHGFGSVRPAGATTEGIRFGSFVMGTVAELRALQPGWASAVLFPATPGYFSPA